MAFFNHVIEADISANTYPEPILVKQGDSGRAIIIYPTSGGEPWLIPDGATAVVHILNPMHQSATYEAEITENEGRQCILFRLSAEALLEAGRASMDATVTVNGVTVSTLNFMLDIEPAPASDFPIPTPGGGVTREELEAALIANSVNDNQYTDYKVRALRVDTGSQIAKVREEAGIRMAPVVSFVDDDGAAQIYTTLYPWMQEHQVPYCFAISTGTVDNTPKYVTAAQLREMNQNKLVNWSCHMVGDDVMSDFTTAEYEARIIQWKASMNGFGLPNTARTIMYNHGIAVQETLDTVVSKYFRAGFTVTKGINEPPFDTLRMKRCGLFPTDEGFSLNDARGKVLELLAAGTGWLVFFTHCYYESFNLEELTELVSFIRDIGIEIAGVEDVLTRYERFEEKGEDGHWEAVEVATQSSRIIGKATSATPGLPANSSSSSNCVTEPAVLLDGAKRVKVSGTAYSQESGSYGKYSFVSDDNTVIYCDYWPDVRAGDNATFDLTVEVPNGATRLYVSGNSTRRMPAVSLWREGTAPGGGISREELEQALSENSTADREFAASAAMAAANQAMEVVKGYVDEQDDAFFQSLDASNRRIAALEAKPAGVSQADFETYKSQFSESIVEISNNTVSKPEFENTFKTTEHEAITSEYTNEVGGFTVTPNGKRTDFIQISGASAIYAKTKLGSTGTAVAFYDGNKNFISGISIRGTGEEVEYTLPVKNLANAVYVVVSGYNYTPIVKTIANYDLEAIEELKNNVSDINAKSEKYDKIAECFSIKGTNYFDTNNAIYQEGYYPNLSGVIQANANAKMVVFPVEPNTEYVMHSEDANRWIAVENKLSSFANTKTYHMVSSSTVGDNCIRFTTGENARWVAWYFRLSTEEYDYGVGKYGFRLLKGTEYIAEESVYIKKEHIQNGFTHYNTFSVIGDSYSSFAGYMAIEDALTWYPPNASSSDTNDVRKVDDTWWYKFANLYGSRLIENNSWSGATICKDGYGAGTDDAPLEAFVNRVHAFTTPELILIFGGTNDEWVSNNTGRGDAILGEYKYSDWTETDLEYFRPALACLIDRIRHKCIGSQIVFILNTNLPRVTPSIEEICGHLDVPIVHLHDIAKAHSHPTIAGMSAIAKQVTDFLNS